MSLKDTIAAADDRRTELVTVPEWGNVRLLLKSLDGADYRWFVKLATVAGRDLLEMAMENASELIQRATYDPDHPADLVFAREDIAGILEQKSLAVRQGIVGKIVTLTMPSESEVSAEKKDSSTAATSASGTP